MTTSSIDSAPEVLGKRNKYNLLVITCPYCGQRHAHGGGEKFGSGNGHRIAHCQTPGNDAGYCIKEV